MRNISKKTSQLHDERTASRMKTSCLNLFGSAAVAALLCPALVSASPILGSDVASFTILGASAVVNVPTSSINGNVGVWSSGGANSISGFLSSPGTAVSDLQVTGGLVHAGNTIAQSAQAQLTAAMTNLGSMGAGTTLSLADMAGLTLRPGVYTVPAGTTNLSGTLTLDGQGNANAAWVFQMPSTLITSPNSVVNMINAGTGAGLFWNVGSSATIDTNTTFLGNIFSLASITMNTLATDNCGRALASTGGVTLGQNSLSNSCTDSSTGLSGGLDVITEGGVTRVDFLAPATTTPIPAAAWLLGSGLMGLAGLRRRKGLTGE
jgi:hypothetical protein